MNDWTAIERRWGRALLEGMIPVADEEAGGRTPADNDARPSNASAERPANGNNERSADSSAGRPPGGIADIDLEPFFDRFASVAPPMLRIGFRAAVWALTFLPPLTFFSLRPFHRLPTAERDRFLLRCSNSRLYSIRQLIMVIKLVACLAFFRDPAARARFPEVAL